MESVDDLLFDDSLEELDEDSLEPVADEAAPPTASCALFSREVISV